MRSSTACSSATAQELAARLIRTADGVELKHWVRGSLDERHAGSLSQGTAAKQRAAGADTLPPAKRSCPHHVHQAEEGRTHH